MQENRLKTRAVVAQVVCIAAPFLLSTQIALACTPEIKFDSTNGVAQPRPDLEAALAELEGSLAMTDATR